MSRRMSLIVVLDLPEQSRSSSNRELARSLRWLAAAVALMAGLLVLVLGGPALVELLLGLL